LAGNVTVLGSIANLIVVEKAARRGVVIGFCQSRADAAHAGGGNAVADVALMAETHRRERSIASGFWKKRYGRRFPAR
jgi:hypothetical protein